MICFCPDAPFTRSVLASPWHGIERTQLGAIKVQHAIKVWGVGGLSGVPLLSKIVTDRLHQSIDYFSKGSKSTCAHHGRAQMFQHQHWFVMVDRCILSVDMCVPFITLSLLRCGWMDGYKIPPGGSVRQMCCKVGCKVKNCTVHLYICTYRFQSP